MIFEETRLLGVFTVSLEKKTDHRGFFARSWCKLEFEQQNLNNAVVQCNISFNHSAGTVRGIHYQEYPFEEYKLVRCTRGSVFDVIVDVRKDSLTYLNWVTIVLSEENHKAVYIPSGFAHGFQTLEDNTEVTYQMSEYYSPQSSSGLRWNDPKLSIPWPMDNPILSERDKTHPLL